MADLSIEVQRLNEVLQSYKTASKKLPEAVLEGVYAWGLTVVNTAKKMAPVDQGRLRGSITAVKGHGGGTALVRIGTNVKYAPFVEYGTGIYNVHGEGRRTPWVFPLKSPSPKMFQTFEGRWSYSKNLYWFWTRGSHPRPFLGPAVEERAEHLVPTVMRYVEKLLGGGK